MHKLKKAAAVVAMVGGMGLVGGGVAHAGGDHGYDDPFGFQIDNLQVVECDQDFDAGAAFVNAPITALGDNNQNIGNFCTVVGSIED
ncbi:hypothetical protein [Streptomyces sp. ALI-76-A]|jgi:hypothetical protein|uniref:hypothetical protein n=1 Tax=Streptomyces sp. ALI-76-A TaxID=3025736 RepID=UPI00256EF6B2|nr:hypothetical protein [Streptomyces sp. ALI-76-A]MDL5201668.1 hypothetical protein [Streptomyces sp. ALI-76-A]